MTDEIGRNFVQAIERMLANNTKKRLVFFVVGRTGWGKSSTVNSLVGKEVSKVNDYESETADVVGFNFEINEIKATVFDTPGLCDGSGNEQAYINLIRSKVPYPDSMLYVSRLDETRPENDRRSIKIISEALGPIVWQYAVIVFTFANNVKASEYQTKLTKKTQIIRKLIAEEINNGKMSYRIPVVAIDNTSKTTPDGKQWLGNLFTAIVDRVSREATIALLGMLTKSIKNRAILNKKQKAIIRRKFVDAVLQSGGSAMGIGVAVAGFLNVPLTIGFSAGGIAGILIAMWLSKYDDE
ncbi:50S ribosome-binding GTPase [Lyngbya sp. CCAP 1446/10]|uniref:GTPase n=1 Tax=Microcoleaceae TaxID=1892252 RepID=UPI0022373818|nr:GTPase [Lyngbya sp. CCAP 1446/10]MCW6051741.1 50S ribosome-binding GTPase [Lyngbya sp. CCAP 1446/10]